MKASRQGTDKAAAPNGMAAEDMLVPRLAPETTKPRVAREQARNHPREDPLGGGGREATVHQLGGDQAEAGGNVRRQTTELSMVENLAEPIASAREATAEGGKVKLGQLAKTRLDTIKARSPSGRHPRCGPFNVVSEGQAKRIGCSSDRETLHERGGGTQKGLAHRQELTLGVVEALTRGVAEHLHDREEVAYAGRGQRSEQGNSVIRELATSTWKASKRDADARVEQPAFESLGYAEVQEGG